jgi:hypothetical protein
MSLVRIFIAVVVSALCAFPARSEDGFALLPREIALHGPQASQRLLVQRVEDGKYVGLVENTLEFASSDEQIVKVEDGVAVPVANGQATITATVAGKDAASAAVTVTGMDQQHAWSFRHDVLPVLAKSGCNSGACHGALAGKGGFKLSLRGYDPESDHFVITRQARGRRIELADPGRSLFLAKPSGAIPHKGGVRFETDSREYEILSKWIQAGAPAPKDADPRVDHLEILPESSLLKPGGQQQVIVRAHYTSGEIRDVTRFVKFTSTNEAVAAVDQDGRVSVMGPGEGAISGWYASQIVMARITVPYGNQVDPAVFAAAPRKNFIDELVLEKLAALNLPPSPPAGDEEFLRRVFLDVIGTLPTSEEARKFLSDQSPDKRDKLIEELLSRKEFVDYWTYKWSDVLMINGTLLRPGAVKSYYQWVRGHVEKNTPWDEFVRQIVTSQGNSDENGATNFFALHQDPENMAENVSQAFMGLSIACAKCHNHPLEKWTNDQYYAFANLFARVRAKGWGGESRSGDGNRTLYVVDRGELIQPLRGKPQPPTPLDGQPLDFEATEDRRIALATWLTSPENPYFARSITNRVWANFFGVGLVEQVDDLRMSNPSSNEKLLSAAADYLVQNKFDLKALMRAILQSAAYQRSSLPLAENAAEGRFYSRYYPKRLMAEVLLDAMSQATGVPSEFNEIAFPGADKEKTEFYPKGTRAIALYDSAVASYFLKTFGRNQRRITCECERSNEPSMVQVLHLSNGDTINQKLAAADNALDKQVAAGKTDAEIIDEAYLSSLSRYPTEGEKREILAELSAALAAEAAADPAAQAAARRLLLEDVYWAVMSSREFLFNH